MVPISRAHPYTPPPPKETRDLAPLDWRSGRPNNVDPTTRRRCHLWSCPLCSASISYDLPGLPHMIYLFRETHISAERSAFEKKLFGGGGLNLMIYLPLGLPFCRNKGFLFSKDALRDPLNLGGGGTLWSTTFFGIFCFSGVFFPPLSIFIYFFLLVFLSSSSSSFSSSSSSSSSFVICFFFFGLFFFLSCFLLVFFLSSSLALFLSLSLWKQRRKRKEGRKKEGQEGKETQKKENK